MEVNDLFLLFTDGIYEVVRDEEEYGMTRLQEAVGERAQLPTELLLDELLENVRRFAGTADFEDDVCLVGMEVQEIGR